MIVECPRCGFGYHAGARCCPKCRAYETPADARRVVVGREAAVRIESGDGPAEIREWLLEEGFTEQDADEIVRLQLTRQRSTARSLGFGRFVLGVVLLLAAGAVFAVAVCIPLEASLLLRRFRIILLWGAAITGTLGGAAFLSGLAGILFGRNLAVLGSMD